MNSAYADSIGDVSNISLQITVSESDSEQKCGFDYSSSAMKLSHTSIGDCSYSSEKLLVKARELTSKKVTYFDSMQIVTLTVTTP